uniref:GDP/GTP exchange factor Sec2 N-terminal domain-containing protein n=1 Tax=Acrobeloides nanus TaxID=290746 RepID=A0A914BYA4_9BILA
MSSGNVPNSDLCFKPEEAYKMVSTAEERRELAEKMVTESLLKIDVLQSEVHSMNDNVGTSCSECDRLKKILKSVDGEVHELTEQVFQEAYKMVNSAEELRERAEKREAEARLKVDVLQAEVGALKAIVKTPKRLSFANRILNGTPIHITGDSSSYSLFSRKFNILPSVTPPSKNDVFAITRDNREVDPISHREFVNWRENSLGLNENSAFLKRAIHEDIMPCLVFENSELALEILEAIKKNTLEMEPLNEGKSNLRECALTKVTRHCIYHVRLDAESEWLFVSLLARNRIAAICDFFTYLRYLHQGILKTGIHDSYWEIVNLKKNLVLARLGLDFTPKMYNQPNPDY